MDRQLFEIYHSQVSEDGIEFLRELAKNRLDGNSNVPWDNIPIVETMSSEKFKEEKERFHDFGFLERGGTRTVVISEKGLRFLHHFDNRPPKDYWNEITVWFKSRWWSVPVFLFVVGVPLISAWKEIITWFVSTIFSDTPPPQ